MLLASATAPVATGSAPIWVAAIGALSLICGALIPEVFKLFKPRVPEAAAGVGVTVEQFKELQDRVSSIAVSQGTVDGQLRGIRREQWALREAMEGRDREHRKDLGGVLDELQRHLWADHGFDRRRADTGPQSLVPPPR